MSLMNRSGLNSVRSSIGMGQGNIRSAGTRNKDMASTYNAVSSKSPFPAPMPQFIQDTGWGGNSAPQAEPTSLDSRGGWGGVDPVAPYAGGGTGWRAPRRAPIKPPADFFTRNAAVAPAPPKPQMAYPDQDIADPLPTNYATSYVPPNFSGGY